MKILIVALLLIGSATPALAGNDRCNAYLHVIRSDNSPERARRDSQRACYEMLQQVGGSRSYCMEPEYAGRVGNNNIAYDTQLVFTRGDGSMRRACRDALNACNEALYHVGGRRDYCSL